MVSPPTHLRVPNIKAGGMCAKLLRTHARSFHYQLLYEVRFTVLRGLTPFDTTRFLAPCYAHRRFRPRHVPPPPPISQVSVVHEA